MQLVIVGQNMAGRVKGRACTVEEEEVVVVWGEWDVLGFLGSQGSHNGGRKSRANVDLGAGKGSCA